MRSFVILLAGIFSFVSFDLWLFRKRYLRYDSSNSISIELTDHREKRKKRKRKFKNTKYKKVIDYRQKSYQIKGTNSKDKRFSNQRLLRRMYRNS